MTTRQISFAENEHYHIYNRGTDKRVIFNAESDYVRFMELLFLANTSQSINIRDVRKSLQTIYEHERSDVLVHIGAYCLMPNHFHILLTPAQESGVQKFMLKLATGYSMYFNKKYDRSGALFEGRYKSEYVDSDEYLKYLFSYIHLNPLKLLQADWKEIGLKNIEGGKEYLEGYRYGSYQDYMGIKREESQILNIQKFPLYFPDINAFEKEIADWMHTSR